MPIARRIQIFSSIGKWGPLEPVPPAGGGGPWD